MSELRGRWLRGYVIGTVVAAGSGDHLGFPALILDADGDEVPVDVLESADLPAHWQRLDAFEGRGYERVTTTVHTPEGAMEASVYAFRGAR